MARFTKSHRQKIIDEYLAESGNNMFHAGEFIDWLSDNPYHEAYPWFFAKDDSTAAREYRIGLARQMVSGLRIVAKVSTAPSEGKAVNVTVREFPAYVSPGSGRRGGGGYGRFDPDNAGDMDELRRQGFVALKSWLSRYRGAFTDEETAVLDGLLAHWDAADAA